MTPRQSRPAAKLPKPRAAAAASAGLTLRDLNRATLARQLLLERARITVATALERLVGLQAQLPRPPYLGLWTRLAGFERRDLAEPIERREVVRAPLLRGTLHLVTAGDFLRIRPVMQSMLTRAFHSTAGQRTTGIDPFALATEARPFLEQTPRTQDEVRDFLAARHPKLDRRMMGHAVRLHLPLVQTPGAGSWGFDGAPAFALGDAWLGRPFASSESSHELIRRYLGAFGPATPADFQTWSGLAGAREAFAELRDQLRVLQDASGRELFDLPDAALPGADAPSDVRFLPDYDNVLLAHSNRARIVPDEYRKLVFLPGLRVAATILVDGFVGGVWSIELAKKRATLVITPFASPAKEIRSALIAEGEKLARFLEPAAAGWEVHFASR